MQANRCKHVRTFLIGYRSGGTPCVFSSRNVCWNCGPSTREQCLPAPRQPPGSSCCLSLLAGGFRPTTAVSTVQSPISTADNSRSLIDTDGAKTPRNPILLPYLYIITIPVRSPTSISNSITPVLEYNYTLNLASNRKLLDF